MSDSTTSFADDIQDSEGDKKDSIKNCKKYAVCTSNRQSTMRPASIVENILINAIRYHFCHRGGAVPRSAVQTS